MFIVLSDTDIYLLLQVQFNPLRQYTYVSAPDSEKVESESLNSWKGNCRTDSLMDHCVSPRAFRADRTKVEDDRPR